MFLDPLYMPPLLTRSGLCVRRGERDDGIGNEIGKRRSVRALRVPLCGDVAIVQDEFPTKCFGHESCSRPE